MTALSPDTLTYGDDPTAIPAPNGPHFSPTTLARPAMPKPSSSGPSERARPPIWFMNSGGPASSPSPIPPGPTLLEIPFQLLMAEGHAEIPPGFAPRRLSRRRNRSTEWPRFSQRHQPHHRHRARRANRR